MKTVQLIVLNLPALRKMNKKHAVIIVEDEAIIADMLAMFVESLGHHVIEICDEGEEALVACEVESPFLVLLDITLKGKMNGIEVAKRLNQMNIPFIFVSSNTNDKALQEVRMTNPLGFIFKPFSREQFQISFELAISTRNFQLAQDVNRFVVEKQPSDYGLTPSEFEVLCFLYKGKTSKEIGLIKKKSFETVNKQRKMVLEKLEVTNALEAVNLGQRLGWFLNL